jgi:4-alpha-glucanotransferase
MLVAMMDPSSVQDRRGLHLQVIAPRKNKRRVRHFRAFTKSVAGVFHWVAEYFALEKQKGRAMNLQKVVDSTAAACQVSRKTVIKVRKCDDIENGGSKLTTLIRGRVFLTFLRSL